MAENEAITFWKLLETKVEIPIIQRDYAQGREDKEELRNRFLGELIAALDGTPIVLDFIYGSRSDSNSPMNPLDGQQRLTTLFLLHWYLAYNRAEPLNDEIKTRLSKFTYETRVSSRDFCKAIVYNGSTLSPTSNDLSSEIEEQTWFFAEWIQDPTIKSMLTMLDCINNKLKTSSNKFSNYWETLVSEQCPISFYYLPLTNFGLSDDLYVKMNARGKQLTYFENFKADLIDCISKERSDEKQDDFLAEVEMDGKMMPYYLSISQKLDNGWTDVFWKNNHEGKIDAIYLAFLNRFFLNEIICNKEIIDKEWEYRSANETEKDKSFQYFYGIKSDDSAIEYQSFDTYESLITIERLNRLSNIFSNLNNNGNIISLLNSSWGDTIDLIPQYKDEKKSITTLTQKQRILFFAITRYLEAQEFNELSFKQWMRVIWNIVENSGVENPLSMIGCMRLIDELSEHSHQIHNFLLEDIALKSKFAEDQVKEERGKVKQILNNETGIWENKIIDAEQTAFFKGAIRFLFRTVDMTYDWSEFDNKLDKAKQYFDVDGVKPDYRSSAILLRSLIKRFDEWEQFKQLCYDNSSENWKQILLKNDFLRPVDDILMTECLDTLPSVDLKTEGEDNKEIQDLIHKDLSNSNLLEYVAKGTLLNWRGDWNSYALYYRNCRNDGHKFLIGNKRNEVFYNLEKEGVIEVDKWQRIEGLPYFRGKEIFFTSKINNKKHQWWSDSLEEINEMGDIIFTSAVKLDDLKEYLENT